MFEKRKQTEKNRWMDRLLADVQVYDQDEILKLMRSGFSYEESLEFLRATKCVK